MITQEEKNQVIEEYLKEKESKKPIIIQFTLSMPNRNSWNGRWSGEKDLFAIIKKFSTISAKENAKNILQKGDFYYNFGDGWGANVNAKQVTGREASIAKKKSRGFCGYNWMVESILNKGEIKT